VFLQESVGLHEVPYFSALLLFSAVLLAGFAVAVIQHAGRGCRSSPSSATLRSQYRQFSKPANPAASREPSRRRRRACNGPQGDLLSASD
jgi:hypothetical protein